MKKAVVGGLVAAVMAGSVLAAPVAAAAPLEFTFLEREQKTEPKGAREARNPSTGEEMRTVREVKKAGDGTRAPVRWR